MDNVYIMRNFIAAIILQAVRDWIKQPKNRIQKYDKCETFKVSRDEIRSFLNSKWGSELCFAIDQNPQTILKKLENGEFDANLLETEEEE